MAIKAGDILWTLAIESNKFESGLAKAKKSADGLKKNLENTLKSARAVGVGMTAAGGAIVGGLGLAAKAASDFGTSMAAVNTLGVKDLGAIEDTVKDVAATFGQDLTVAAEAAYQAISAGATEAELPNVLASAAKAAAAGMTDLSTSVELGLGVFNAFGGELKDTNEVFDLAFVAVKNGVTTFEELGASVGKASPLFKAAGAGADDMFASIAALTKGGIGTAEAVTSMSAIMKEVIKPTSGLAKVFEDMGGPMAVIEKGGLPAFFDVLKDATGGSAEEMGKLFGSSEALVAALSLTGSASADFKSSLAEMNNGLSATDEAFKALVEADPAFAFRQLKSEMQVLAVDVGTALLPVLNSLIGVVRPVIQTIREWISANPRLTSTLVLIAAAIGGVMVVVGPLLIMLPGLISAFSVMASIIPVVGVILTALTGPIGLIALGIGALAVLIIGNWEWIQERTAAIWNGIAGFIGDSVDGIIGGIKGLIQWVKNALAWIRKLGGKAARSLGFAQGGVIPGFAQGGTIPGFASGGVGMSRIVEVGERGPELAALPIGTRVLSSGQAKQAVSQGVSQRNISVNEARMAGSGDFSTGPVIGNLTLIGDLTERDADKIVQLINPAQARAFQRVKR